MRKLSVDDIYLLSKIADKMDFEMPTYPNMNDKMSEQLKENLQREYGMKLMMLLLKKIYKAKDEVNELVESVSGKNPKEMSIKELTNTIKEIMSQEGALDVFK